MAEIAQTFSIDPYAADRAKIARQQKFAELLESQSLQPNEKFSYAGIEAPVSAAGGLAKALQAGMSGYLQGDAARKEDELATTRDSEEAAAISALNTGFRGTPENLGRRGRSPATEEDVASRALSISQGSTAPPLTLGEPVDVLGGLGARGTEGTPGTPAVPGGISGAMTALGRLTDNRMASRMLQSLQMKQIDAALIPDEIGATKDGKLFNKRTGEVVDAGSGPDVTFTSGIYKLPDGAVVQGRASNRTGTIEILGQDGTYVPAPPGTVPHKEAGADNTNNYSPGGAYRLPPGVDGSISRVVNVVVDRNGRRFYEEKGALVPVPDTAVLTTAGQARSPLSTADFNKLVLQASSDVHGINKFEEYLETEAGTNSGLKGLVDKITANAKTFLQGKDAKLAQTEFNRLELEGKQNALIGMLRLDILGPGVVTEYDARRILSAVGGDITVLRNSEVVKALLEQIILDKRQRVNILKYQIEDQSDVHTAPPNLFAPRTPKNASPPAAPGSPPPPPDASKVIRYNAEGKKLP